MGRRLTGLFPRWSLVAFTALLLLSALIFAAPWAGLRVGIFAEGARQAGAPFGVDSLSDEEAAQALHALRATQGAQSAAVRQAALVDGSGAPITAPLQEAVLIERHVEEKGVMAAGAWERRADVYNYNYADDTLQHAIYNYATGSLTHVETVQGVQFPLSQAERDLATAIAFANPALHAQMQGEYRAITGNELTSPDQIGVRAFVYRAGATPETEPAASAQCGIQRCAQLLIVTPDDTTFHALPVINLSTLAVASINPLVLDPANAPQAVDVGHTHGDATGGGQ